MNIYDNLSYVVECKPAGQAWFESIAAFNVASVARAYMVECGKTNPTFMYRLITIGKGK